tara:strand:- start:966 stop:1151 length:186 start_codon:yes stop_codon:yes gene_type:complete
MNVKNIIKRKCFSDIEPVCFIKNGIHKKMIKSTTSNLPSNGNPFNPYFLFIGKNIKNNGTK